MEEAFFKRQAKEGYGHRSRSQLLGNSFGIFRTIGAATDFAAELPVGGGRGGTRFIAQEIFLCRHREEKKLRFSPSLPHPPSFFAHPRPLFVLCLPFSLLLFYAGLSKKGGGGGVGASFKGGKKTTIKGWMVKAEAAK